MMGSLSVYRVSLFTTALVAATLSASAQEVESESGSDLNTCRLCHTTPELWSDEQQRLHLNKEELAEDAHFLAGVQCADCHGGNPTSFQVPEAHAQQPSGEKDQKHAPFRSPLEEVQKACADCHTDQIRQVATSIHRSLGAQPDSQVTPTTACSSCHGEIKHRTASRQDRWSRIRRMERCGDCHKAELATYMNSIHGWGLEEAGLIVTAVCADCHGAHAILPNHNPDSTVYPDHVATTCGQCHQGQAEEVIGSIHGWDAEQGPGTGAERKPSCADCHPAHVERRWSGPLSKRTSRIECGSCHKQADRLRTSGLHGIWTERQFQPAAQCYECHGGHDILAATDPDSHVAPGPQRQQTCRRCHPGVGASFCDYHPHVDYHQEPRYARLFSIQQGLTGIMFVFLAVALIHGVAWWGRWGAERLRGGLDRDAAIGMNTLAVRYAPCHAIAYVVAIISIIGLCATGVPLRYHDQPWAIDWAHAMGGFQTASNWHRICGIFLLGAVAWHIIASLMNAWRRWRRGTPWREIIAGPDSRLPTKRQFAQCVATVRWFFGRGPKPEYDRWSYWEVSDYWVSIVSAMLIGITGLLLWMPDVMTRIWGTGALHFATIVHGHTALLIIGVLLAIHIWNHHLRPRRFPVDWSLTTGMLPSRWLRDERPAFWQRLRESGGERPPDQSALGGWLRVIVYVGSLVIVLAALAAVGLVLSALLSHPVA